MCDAILPCRAATSASTAGYLALAAVNPLARIQAGCTISHPPTGTCLASCEAAAGALAAHPDTTPSVAQGAAAAECLACSGASYRCEDAALETLRTAAAACATGCLTATAGRSAGRAFTCSCGADTAAATPTWVIVLIVTSCLALPFVAGLVWVFVYHSRHMIRPPRPTTWDAEFADTLPLRR